MPAIAANARRPLTSSTRPGHVAARVASPLTQGWLAAVASEVHAVAGDAKASLGALEQAGHALGRADEDDEASWIGVGTFNHAKLEAYHGVCYLQLGRPGDAVPALTKALDTLDPALKKHRCTALADLATGLIQLREVEEGCERGEPIADPCGRASTCRQHRSHPQARAPASAFTPEPSRSPAQRAARSRRLARPLPILAGSYQAAG